MPEPPPLLSARVARVTGLVGRVAVAVLDEAWREAGLDAFNPERIGLVIGGSNLQSRESLLLHQAYADRLAWLPPTHGYAALDTDLCGLCTSQFPIRGFANTVGGASASGSLAVLQAALAVRSGRVDACIALGALQDVSFLELQALKTLGALSPGVACRPFDAAHDGFMYGESCAALVLVRADLGIPSYGTIAGGAHIANGNRGPNPSSSGELRVIAAALKDSGFVAQQIDYVNTHGTGTPLGDDTEAAALRISGLSHAHLNATKSLIGHGLSAAGAIEMAVVLLQMQQGRLHPTLHLEHPVLPDLNWVLGSKPKAHRIHHALKLSFGFGGIDTAIIVSAP